MKMKITVALLLASQCAVATSTCITNYSQLDGFGSQFLHVISAVIYAETHNMQFVYTPFISMEHDYHNEPGFLAKKEWLINFADNFEVNKNETIFKPRDIVKFFFSEDNLALFACSASLKKIKEVFRVNKKDDY